MASYHLSVKVGGKGKALIHAHYIAREDKYARRRDEDLVHVESGNMPDWAAHKPAEFWAAADDHERANGCTYREIEIALPRELDDGQRLALVRHFVSQEIGERHAYQFAIHNPKAAIAGGEQPHAHIMFSERYCDGIDRDPEQYFKRANSKNPERGGAKKVRFGETPTERKAYLTEQRSRWADLQNAYLEKYQHDDRVDARSYKAQGIDRQPERHLGPYQVRQLDVTQLQALIDRREAESVAFEQKAALQGVIDVTSSLHSVLHERDEAQRTSPAVEQEQRQPGKANQDEINKLVNTAMGDIQQDIDLQSLIDSSMAEFAGIHQQQLKQQEQLKQAKLQKQREVERQKQAEKLKQQQSQQSKPKFSRGPRI